MNLIASAFELERFFRINQKRMMAIENSFYQWKDILCLIMDMMGVDRPYFYLSDLLNRYFYAPHFINIFTNFNKFKNFIEKDTFITAVYEPYTDIYTFYKKNYERFTNCQQDDQEVPLID